LNRGKTGFWYNCLPIRKTGYTLQEDRLARQLAATASCGFCGKENLDGLSWEPAWFPEKGQPQLSADRLLAMNQQMEEAQEIFARTGGLHAAALFSLQPENS
jgi:FdhD protein